MKIEQLQIDKIRIAFQNLQSKEDLLQLMNEVKPLIYGEKTVPFQMKQLTWFSNPKLAKKRYTQFTIKKKSGADRTINAPVTGLKVIQRVLSVILQCVYEPHHAAFGFVKDKSIVDNAKLHVGSKYVYNIDLKDFFQSIDQARVWKCLQLKPFELNDENAVVKTVKYYKFYSLEDFFIENEITHLKLFFINKKGYLHLTKSENDLQNFIEVKISNNVKLSQMSNNKKLDAIVNAINNYVVVEFRKDDNIWYSLNLKDQKDYNQTTKLFSKQELSNIISGLCCTEMEVERKSDNGEWIVEKRNVLPQGAPTSPILTNVICQRLDYLLTAVAKRFGLNYSRYADDITFSSMHNVYQPESDFIKELHRIIKDQGFHIKESKTRLQKEGYRKEVTGLLVNDKVNVQKRYIKQLRMWLYYWETYGYERAQNYFIQQYVVDKDNVLNGKPDMINVIDGKLNYLKMVKGGENELYLRLRERYNKLTAKYSFIEKVINVWENEGLEKAMNLYYLNSDIVQEKSVENFESKVDTDNLDLDDLINNLIYGPPPNY